MYLKKDKCGEIVDRLVVDFWSSNEKNLKNEESVITQDFISRGLSGSTARVSKLVHLNYTYLQNLINELIHHLEEDYSHVSPASVKPELIKVVETEYNKLANKPPKWLMESNQINQLIVFESSIAAEKEKAKKDVENKCELWAERWNARRKWWRNPNYQWTIAVAIAVMGLLLTALTVDWRSIKNKFVNIKSTIPSTGVNSPSSNVNNKKISPESKVCNSPYLSEEQIIGELGKLKNEGEIDEAIHLLPCLKTDRAKDEETWSIFNYCIANKRPDEANAVVEYFRLSEDQETAKNILGTEQMKWKRLK
jgi:hypothetical protein